MDAAAQRQSSAKRLTTEKERGSGEQGRSPEPRFLIVGQVVGVHGVRGELKVQILTEDPHRFGRLKQVLVGLEDQEPEPWLLQRFRLHKGNALLKLANCDDCDTAERLRGSLIQVPLEMAIPLEEDEFYEHQILNLEVWTMAGEFLGKVVEILHTGANDVYVVQSTVPGRRELLLPAISDVILEVDLAGGRLVVQLPEGL
jgi:16S rRNA processing protein RimM